MTDEEKETCEEYEHDCSCCPFGKFIPRKTKPAYQCTAGAKKRSLEE